MRLRQVALVAQDLEAVVEDLCSVLGIEVGFRDPGIETFGLHNAVMPVGDTFLEVVSPQREGTSAGRLLDRRGGDGGYMVIVQVGGEDLGLIAERKRLAELGVRIVWETALDDIATIHLHPRDVGGAILSLDVAVPPASWRWAGPRWQSVAPSPVSRAIEGAVIQADDPQAMAERWSRALDRPAVQGEDGNPLIPLDVGRIRFVPASDGRGEGVSCVEIGVRELDTALAAARARGLPVEGHQVTLCGTRVQLIPPL